MIADSRGNVFSARVINRIKGVERCLRKVGPSPSHASEQNDTLRVGDPRDGVDKFHGWVDPKKAGEERANLAAPQAAESARRRHSNIGIEVIQKRQQQRNGFRPSPHKTASIRPYLRVSVAQHIKHGVGREARLKARGRGKGLPQGWSEDDLSADRQHYCLSRLGSADLGERIEGGRLFGHDLIDTKAGIAPTQRLQDRDRRRQPTPSDFGGPSEDVANPGGRHCGDQAVTSSRSHAVTGRVSPSEMSGSTEGTPPPKRSSCLVNTA